MTFLPMNRKPFDVGGMSGLPMPQIEPTEINIPQPKPRAGMFGAGGVGRAIAGSIGDFLLQRAGAGPVYAPVMQQRQQAALEGEQYERRRNDQWDSWVQQQEWKRANPDAPQPTEFERLASSVYQPGTPEYTQLLTQYVTSRANPPYFFTDPTTGQVMSLPRNGGGVQPGAAAAPGVTFTPLDEGGAGGNVSGNFR